MIYYLYAILMRYINEILTQADYALRFKAGLKRPLAMKRLSEYQKQFSWQSQPNVTPLLAAEQVCSV